VRQREGAVGGVLGAVLAGVLVAGCSGSGSTSASAPASSGSSTASAAGPTSSASATTSPSGAGSSPDASASVGSLATVPPKVRATLRPVKPSTPVTVGGGARAILISSQNVTVTGRGPGELSGPAVALTLQVTNGSSRALDLSTATVSANVRGEEASASDAAPSKPFPGTLAPGARAVGVYVFVLPSSGRRPVGVVVSLAPDLPVARFTLP
jgi:hypothetical protein